MARTRFVQLVAGATAFALFVVACAPDDEDPAEPGEEASDDDTEDAADETDDTADEPTGDLDDSATIRGVMAAGVTIETLDPDAASGGNGLRLSMPIYDRLIHMDVVTSELEPGLAESWEFQEDNNVLQLNLREGVLFHDGAEFNAEVVEANFERSREREDIGRRESTIAVEAVGEIEIVDDYTVRLHRAEGVELDWSLLPARLTENLGMMMSPNVLDVEELDRDGVGAGAWKFVEIVGDTIVYERFDDYWNPEEPMAAQLELTSLPDDEATFAAVVSGEQDLAVIQAPQRDRADSEADAGRIQLFVADTLINWHLWLHHDLPPLDSLEFRQAMQHAVDREALVDAIQFGQGVATVQHFPPGHFAYNEDHGIDRWGYDPDRALELLDEAGYDGETLLIEVATTPELRVRLAEALVAQYSEVGINVELDIVDRAERAFAFQEPPTHGFLGQRTRVDALQHLADSYGPTASFNPAGRTVDDRTEELLTQCAELAAGSPEWEDCLKELSGHTTEQAAQHSFFVRQETWVANPCLVGWQAPAGQQENWRTVGVQADC